jgi:hypothetical protein
LLLHIFIISISSKDKNETLMKGHTNYPLEISFEYVDEFCQARSAQP